MRRAVTHVRKQQMPNWSELCRALLLLSHETGAGAQTVGKLDCWMLVIDLTREDASRKKLICSCVVINGSHDQKWGDCIS